MSMRAAIKRGKAIVVDEMEIPRPGKGQVLVKTLHCGICGSDLHCLHDLAAFADVTARCKLPTGSLEDSRDLVFGHEFSAQIAEYGPGSKKPLAEGSVICALNALSLDNGGLAAIGYSHDFPGGYAEYFLVGEAMMLLVPNGLDSAVAAMTEPMSIAVHAVGRADHRNSAYLVQGCGPIGLSVIIELKARGLGPVLAADLSPERRQMAELLGADFVVDPAVEDPHEYWQRLGVSTGGFYDASGGAARRAVAFECVGARGMLNRLLNGLPSGAQIMAVGVCTVPDQFEPMLGLFKEIDIRYSLGFTVDEFSRTLRRLAEGELLATPLITSVIGLDQVPAAFETLAKAKDQAKIMIAPAGDLRQPA